jgi:hypothetical protein
VPSSRFASSLDPAGNTIRIIQTRAETPVNTVSRRFGCRG